MTNGLGAGFFALTLLAALAGLASFIILTTITAAVYRRRQGHIPTLLRHVLVAIGLAVLGVAGFGILVLYDEAPVVAWLIAWIVVVPLFVTVASLVRTIDASRREVFTMTVMAWGGPFVLGLILFVGVMSGIDLVLGLAPAEIRQLGVAWAAATVAGLSVTLCVLVLGTRYRKVFHPPTARSVD